MHKKEFLTQVQTAKAHIRLRIHSLIKTSAVCRQHVWTPRNGQAKVQTIVLISQTDYTNNLMLNFACNDDAAIICQ